MTFFVLFIEVEIVHQDIMSCVVMIENQTMTARDKTSINTFALHCFNLF